MQGFDSEVVEKIHAMIMCNEKKRYQFPPVLRLSMCSFGHECLMPLTNINTVIEWRWLLHGLNMARGGTHGTRHTVHVRSPQCL